MFLNPTSCTILIRGIQICGKWTFIYSYNGKWKKVHIVAKSDPKRSKKKLEIPIKILTNNGNYSAWEILVHQHNSTLPGGSSSLQDRFSSPSPNKVQFPPPFSGDGLEHVL